MDLDMKSKRHLRRVVKSQPLENKAVSARQGKSPQAPAIEVDTLDWECCCRAMLVAIEHQSPKEAHAALDRFLVGKNVRQAITWDSPVSSLEFFGEKSLGVREINALESAGYESIRAFMGSTDQDLLMIRNFSTGTLKQCQEIKGQLRVELGLVRRPANAIERILRG
jgi:hypothetical protein